MTVNYFKCLTVSDINRGIVERKLQVGDIINIESDFRPNATLDRTSIITVWFYDTKYETK